MRVDLPRYWTEVDDPGIRPVRRQTAQIDRSSPLADRLRAPAAEILVDEEGRRVRALGDDRQLIRERFQRRDIDAIDALAVAAPGEDSDPRPEACRGFFGFPGACPGLGFAEESSSDAGPDASGTRLHRDPAHVPFAAALGGYIRIAAQREMDNTALVRRHWLQDDRPPRTSDLPSDSLGQANERLFAAGAVALDVDHHASPVLEATVGDE